MTEQSSKLSRTSFHEYPTAVSRSSIASDFENLVHKSLPNWNALWQMMAKEKYKDKTREKFGVRLSKSENKDLRKKIEKKAHELVNEEETLVNLYMKAAKAAKERQEELREKTASLLEQIEKDKSFLKALNEAYRMT